MTDFEFECPHCGERAVVDRGVRELLVAEGCVACSERVSTSDFAEVTRT